jgi:hypothetical protein
LLKNRTGIQIPELPGLYRQRISADSVVEQKEARSQFTKIRLISGDFHFRIREKFFPFAP